MIAEVDMRSIVAILCCLIPAAAVQATEAHGRSVIGVNDELARGARALQVRDYAEGVRLTAAGLRAMHDRRDRLVALSNLCAGYVGLRQYARALAACDEALEINPRFWRAYNNRALAHLGLGMLAAARSDVAEGLAINPNSAKLLRSHDLVASSSEKTLLADSPTSR